VDALCGIPVEVLKQGTGTVSPKATDTVNVHYHGTLLDGTVFDSSVERRAPISFPLNQVIPGWTEALQLMVEGEKRRLWIPAKLAYGETPAMPGAPAGDLVFDVELIEIVKAPETPKDVVLLDEQGKPLTAGDNNRRFFEASWVHKYKDTYYFSYSTGDTHFIMYATGKSPYGPFTVRGKILEPVLGWTNHHSIIEYQGKWYLFYHDAQLSGGQTHLRNIKLTELKYRDDGTIVTVDAYKE